MARLSRATRETIQTISVIVLVLILILVYVVYPLNRSKAFFGRKDVDNYGPKTAIANDPTPFVQAGLKADTVKMESDGLTSLACVALGTGRQTTDSARGMVIVAMDDELDRIKAAPVAAALVDSGFTVWAYDQRGVGASTGSYHSDGQLEAQDIEALVSYLELHGRLRHPLVVVGRGVGADAAMLAPTEEKRIDGVVAIEPYLTTTRMVAELRKQHGLIWFPFWEPTVWWWYKTRSGYVIEPRTMAEIKGLTTRTVLATANAGSPELAALKQGTSPELLRVISVPGTDMELVQAVLSLARR
jgi:hypothetical protein